MGELLDGVHDAVSRIHVLKKRTFIWLSQVLAAAHGNFSWGMWDLSCEVVKSLRNKMIKTSA